MAVCVQFDQTGALVSVPGNLSMNQCTTFIALEPAEYRQIVTANSLYALPASQDFATVWAAGFVLPLSIYMVAWGVAKLVNFFNH